MSVFGKNIRYLRRSAFLTQADLARSLGYKSYTTIQKWEGGQAFPPIATCIKLADLFTVSLEELLQQDLEVLGQQAAAESEQAYQAEKSAAAGTDSDRR